MNVNRVYHTGRFRAVSPQDVSSPQVCDDTTQEERLLSAVFLSQGEEEKEDEDSRR